MTTLAGRPRPTASRLASLRTWGTILAIAIEERLVYRGDFALGTLMRFLPIVTQVFLWTAVFSATSRGDIAGYSRNDIVAYYLLTMLARAFSSMPGLAGGIARSIRDGSIKKFLVQPVDYVAFLLATRVAHKLQYLLSGHMFPIDMLAGIPSGLPGTTLADVVTWLPFQFTAFFPASVWLGKVQGGELVRLLVLEVAWVVVMVVACRVAWARGTRRYSGFGG